MEDVETELRRICPKEAVVDFLAERHPIVRADVSATEQDWINACWALDESGCLVEHHLIEGTETVFACAFLVEPDGGGRTSLVELRITPLPFRPSPATDECGRPHMAQAFGREEELGPDITSARDGRNRLVITFSNIPVRCDFVVQKLKEIAAANKDNTSLYQS
jgi:hypothetical protein